MSVQLLSGLPLLVGGDVALSSDCCCDEPCIECNVCPTCWSSDDDPCSGIASITVTISGVANGISSCGCAGVNGAYVISPQSDGCKSYREYVVARCVLNPTVRYSVDVLYRLGFNSGPDVVITDVGSTTNKVCNAFTIQTGHFVEVIIEERIDQIGFFGAITFRRIYYYSWGNSTIKPGCPDDQTYGLCSLLEAGGAATHVYSRRFSGTGFTPVPITSCDFDFFGLTCDFSGSSVIIGAPDIDAETPPPPPP